MSIQIQGEDIKSSRKKQGKRLLAIYGTTKIELRKELELLFSTFETAMAKANARLREFPTYSRARTLEASIVQSCFAEELIKNFEGKAFFGKYKRLILRVKGYIILFKKLDKFGYPMNIKTASVQSLLNQNQVLDLFQESDYNYDPVLYFGYQKNKFGEHVNPQLIYIDEEKISFSIDANAIQTNIEFDLAKPTDNDENQTSPTLKNNNNLKNIKQG